MTGPVRMRLSRLHHPVTALGPGRRAGIWFQGCSIRCPGCLATDTWGSPNSSEVEVGAVLAWLAGLPEGGPDGVTISGGEPTEQPDALRELLAGIRTWRAGRPVDVLMFTGRDPAWVERQLAHGGRERLWPGLDAVMAGPYVAAEAGGSALRGSENQRLLTLSRLGQERFGELDDADRRRLQLQVTAGGVWLVGIPLPGDLAALEGDLGRAGLALRRPSWRRASERRP